MSTKTALFFVALLLFALDFALKMEPTPLTTTEKARLEAEFERNTEYFFTPDGMEVRTAIFKIPEAKPVFWIYRELFFQKMEKSYKIVNAHIYPRFRIEFGEILRDSHRKSLAERISNE